MKKFFTLLVSMAVAAIPALADTYTVKAKTAGSVSAGEVLENDGTAIKVTANHKSTTNQTLTSSNASKLFSDGVTRYDAFGNKSIHSRLKTAPSSSDVIGVQNETNKGTSFTIVVSEPVNLTVYFVAANGTRGFKLFNQSTAETTSKNGSQLEIWDTSNNAFDVTFENVLAGTYTLFQTGYTGGFLGIKYETLSKGEKLSAPEITFDESTMQVSISSVENGSIHYTTDGSTPTAESTEYTTPFTVTDYTTVKAAAIGDGETYADSEVVEKLCAISNGVVATPVIKQFNGTFAISCETPAAVIEYSLDGGATYLSYSNAITLFEDKTVSARASRTGWDASTSTADIITLPQVKSDKTVRLSQKTLDGDRTPTLTGKDTAEGFSISYNEKSFTLGQGTILNEGAIKGSSFESATVTIPEGYAATRLTFYSITTKKTDGNYWNNINGETIENPGFNMWSTDGNNPDVRVFNLETPAVGTTSFCYTGDQPYFIIDIDLVATKETPVLEYSASAVTFKNGIDNTSILPTLDKTEDIAVNFNSSNENVAMVDENGQVTIVDDGTTTISATFDGNDKYMPAEASYILTISSGEIVVAYQVAGIENVGTEIGADATEENVAKPINGKTVKSYKLGNGWSSSKATYILLSHSEGFKRGDIVTIAGVIANSDATKMGGVRVQAEEGGEVIACTPTFENVQVNTSAEATIYTFTLEDNYAKLYLSRATTSDQTPDGVTYSSMTGTYVTMISVNRPYFVEPVAEAPAAPSHDMMDVELKGGKTVTFTLAENHHQVAVKFVEAEAETGEEPAEGDGRAKAIDHAANGFELLEGNPETNTITYEIPNKNGTLHFYAYDPTTDLASDVQTLDVTEDPEISTSLSTIDAEAAPVEYFNLQGIRVTEPVGGVFIRKQGTQVTKVVK